MIICYGYSSPRKSIQDLNDGKEPAMEDLAESSRQREQHVQRLRDRTDYISGSQPWLCIRSIKDP